MTVRSTNLASRFKTTESFDVPASFNEHTSRNTIDIFSAGRGMPFGAHHEEDEDDYMTNGFNSGDFTSLVPLPTRIDKKKQQQHHVLRHFGTTTSFAEYQGQTATPDDSDEEDEERVLKHIRSLMNKQTVITTTTAISKSSHLRHEISDATDMDNTDEGDEDALSTSGESTFVDYGDYYLEQPDFGVLKKLNECMKTVRQRAHYNSQYAKWKKWVHDEQMHQMVKHDWPNAHKGCFAETRFRTLLWMKTFAVQRGFPRPGLMRAMSFYDIFMSNHRELVSDYHSMVVGGAMLCLVSKLEGLRFFEDEFLDSLTKEIALVEKNATVCAMDKSISDCMNVARRKFMALVLDDLTIPTPMDHMDVLIDHAKLFKPLVFGSSENMNAACPIGVKYPLYSLLETVYMDMNSLRVPYSCLAASVFAYVYGCMFTPEQMKMITGFESHQLGHLSRHFDDLFLRYNVPPILSRDPEHRIDTRGHKRAAKMHL